VRCGQPHSKYLEAFGFLSQARRGVIPTLLEIRAMTDREKINIAGRAALIKAGKVDNAAGKRKIEPAAASARKRVRGQDLPDEEDIEHQDKKHILDIGYILWGHSLKPQIAGVGLLVLLHIESQGISTCILKRQSFAVRSSGCPGPASNSQGTHYGARCLGPASQSQDRCPKAARPTLGIASRSRLSGT
jgi:hypothetical protein